MAYRMAMLTFIGLAVCAAPLVAHASPADASACAARLSAPARMIYDAVAPEVKPGAGTDLHDTVKSHTRDLVMAGKIERAVARPSAIEAGACLRELSEP